MSTVDLFSPFQLGALRLPNRIVMAPMTRCRAIGTIPNDLMADYYRQRATAGLIISEATQISPMSIGYVNTPGIHSVEQVSGWQKITRAVHEANGRIFLQLWHVGRASHSAFLGGKLPVAPSALAIQGDVIYLPDGSKAPYETPRALEVSDIPGIVDEYRIGAQNALVAGFDGVEIHSANGYLIDQFLRDGSNHRTDEYGGSLANRVRFLREVTDAVIGVWGAERVGVRLSPTNGFQDMRDSDPFDTFGYVAEQLSSYGLAYLHTVEGQPESRQMTSILRQKFRGPLMVCGGFDKASANDVLHTGTADLVAFGKLFLANPDLPQRFQLEAPLNTPNSGLFYAPGRAGLTDYPVLEMA